MWRNPIHEVTLPLRHQDTIRQQAADKDLDPALIAAMIFAESRFRDQTSRSGAKGYMQLMPDTALFIAKNSGGTRFELTDLANPDINIRYGSWYLRYLLDRYEQNRIAAIAAYNAGHNHVDRWGGSELDVEDIGFAETSAYVGRVLSKREEYAEHRAEELGM